MAKAVRKRCQLRLAWTWGDKNSYRVLHNDGGVVEETLMTQAYERFKANDEGDNSDVYPALATVPSELIGLCVVGDDGNVFSVAEAESEFSIMSVSKP
jgi:glutaminase